MIRRLRDSSLIPVSVVVAFIILIWYAGAVYLNSPVLIDRYERQKTEWNFEKLRQDAWAMERPILPAPHQILKDMNKSILQRKVTSKRSLVYHGWVTISSTLVGFGIGALLGIVLAVGIVYTYLEPQCDALDHCLTDHTDSCYSPYDYCRTWLNWTYRTLSKIYYFCLSLFFPGHHRNGEGVTFSGSYSYGPDEDLLCE